MSCTSCVFNDASILSERTMDGDITIGEASEDNEMKGSSSLFMFCISIARSSLTMDGIEGGTEVAGFCYEDFELICASVVDEEDAAAF